MLFSMAVLSYTSWKSLQGPSRDLSVSLAIPCAQLALWGRDGLKSSRQTWECLWMSGHCISVSSCEMETIIVPFSALVVTELLGSAQDLEPSATCTVQVLYKPDLCIVFLVSLCELALGVAFPALYPFVPFVIPLGCLAAVSEGLCYPPWSDATSPL